MPVRNRNGKLEWRFWVDGHEWSHITDLADTERNRIKCARLEADARRLVLEGRGDELRLQVAPFSSAAASFEVWAQGEYADHPNTWKRISVSMTSAKKMWGKRPISSLTAGDIEDYKAWRRNVCQVREVTLRHDLHSLSLLFQYALKHNWAKVNPVSKVEIPSDADAVRINVLTPAMEAGYFAVLDGMRLERISRRRPVEAQALQDLSDLHRLMILQGCRPEELRELLRADVDLERGSFTIRSGKSEAAKRTLKMRLESRDIFTRRMATATLSRFVFPSPRDHNKHMGAAQRLHAAVLKRSGLAFVPYDLRHTFASRAANEENVPLGVLATIMGHSNLRSILKYVHTAQADIDREIGRLDAEKPVVKESLTTQPEKRGKVN